LSLAAIFSIDICAYAVMSNHTHLVLHVNECEAKNWSIKQVLERWHRLHKGTQFTQKYLENKVMAEFELASVCESCEKYRKRLMSISWFMKELNEPIARMAKEQTGQALQFVRRLWLDLFQFYQDSHPKLKSFIMIVH